MTDAPSLAAFQKKLTNFLQFLSEKGASIGAPTNEWEVVRFTGQNKMSIVYRNKENQLTFTGLSHDAWKAFKHGDHIDLSNFKKIRARGGSVVNKTLRKRDGDLCFYCVEYVSLGDESTEHVLSAVHGGVNHMSNLVLAHKLCNSRASHLPVMEKVRIRERAVLKKAYYDRLGAKNEEAGEGPEAQPSEASSAT